MVSRPFVQPRRGHRDRDRRPAPPARTANVFRNKVYDIQISGATGSVTGHVRGGGTNNFYNNLVGDLRAPSATTTGNPNIVGLNASGTAGTVNYYYNTVYIAGTSSGSPFSTAGVFAGAGGVLKLRNNIVANASIPTGGGRAVAVWRNYRASVELRHVVEQQRSLRFHGVLRRRHHRHDALRHVGGRVSARVGLVLGESAAS